MHSVNRQSQRGVALIVLLALIGFVLTGALLTFARGSDDSLQRAKITQAALSQAKQGLIDYAASVYLGAACISPVNNCRRPGDLPCPDLNNDGDAEAVPPCDDVTHRVGRLPWKRLELPDLRDGYGERLWYAVSTNFKYNTRTSCTSVGDSGCLNSETHGTITVRDAAGNLVFDAGSPALNGVVAVIFAPGPALTRQDGVQQDRSCRRGVVSDPTCTNAATRDTCSGTGVGNPPDYIQTAMCNPQNYLDSVLPSPDLPIPGVQDNAMLFESVTAKGFIAGTIKDPLSRDVILNDQILVITLQDIMPIIERRVAMEVLSCLKRYAVANSDHYPWTASVSDYSDFTDHPNTRFGRVPDAFTETALTYAALSSSWPPGCTLTAGMGWWMNWKELVFMAVADGYGPDTPFVTCLTCLNVNPEPGAKKVVVIISGKTLPGKTHGQTASIDNYLEPPDVGGSVFSHLKSTDTFNDIVVFQ